MPEDSEYMTVREARIYLGITPNKIAEFIRDGRFTRITNNPFDRRNKLLLRAEVEALARQQDLLYGNQESQDT